MKRKLMKSIGIIPFISKFYSGLATIFMLHRVHSFESDKLSPNENMKVSPEFLEQFIIDLKLNGYEFINLDSLNELLINGESAHKKIVFTLDDGYKDNYEIAYPIFKKHHVPFTIYLTTSFPEHQAVLWWYTLEDLVTQNDSLVLYGNEVIKCKTVNDKVATFLKVREIIMAFKPDDFINRLDHLFASYKINWFDKCAELSMNWDEVNKLAEDELVTIAGHTKNHYALSMLTEAEIKDEIIEANKLIESKINKKIEHFAYPFGSYDAVGQREFNIVKDFGFKTNTTTRSGNIYKEHVMNLESLPRVMLTENFNMNDLGLIRRNKMVTI